MNDSSTDLKAQRRSIDLNADLGEGFPNDRQLLELVTSASICCGAHAGSRDIIRQTLRAASACGVVVGAHPGYRDREGFGRVDQKLSQSEVVDLIGFQLTELMNLAGEIGVEVVYIKPHGALYNQAQREVDVARAVIQAADVFQLPVFGQPGSVLESLARDRRIAFISEGFPDRRYRADGSLVPRGESDAILHAPDEVEAQVLRLLNEGRASTLCIHGDDPRAVTNARLVRSILHRHGIIVRSFRDKLA